jgi:hypothetical protein
MKEQTSDWTELARERFRRDGVAAPVAPTLVAFRNFKTGETRIDVTIPAAHLLDIPKDLGVILQCIGWGMATLDYRLRHLPTNPRPDDYQTGMAWHDCCQVIWKVEYCLELD